MSDTVLPRTPFETARLRIRPFRPDEDDAEMIAVYCDPAVMRFIPGGPLAESAVRSTLERHVAANESGSGFYAIEEKVSGNVIGEIGFGVFATGEREIGWTLAERFWGLGYATEAVVATLDVVPSPLVAAVDAENIASIRVAEKAGLRRREELPLHGRAHVVFQK